MNRLVALPLYDDTRALAKPKWVHVNVAHVAAIAASSGGGYNDRLTELLLSCGLMYKLDMPKDEVVKHVKAAMEDRR